MPSRFKRYNHSILILYNLFHYLRLLFDLQKSGGAFLDKVCFNQCLLFSSLLFSFDLNPLSNLGLVEAYHIGEREKESPRRLSKTDLAICSPDRKSKPE